MSTGFWRRCVIFSLQIRCCCSYHPPQVLSLAADNASPNDVMMHEIVDLLPSMAHLTVETRIRCFAHILNLVVKVGRLFIACYLY
ncbi:hypothetical protein GGX14DRAFT_381043 [Mycena pura]|uniref:Uncharacterized protein n=1 Tax=Mycena pura TaxID=153505 RepID=A0AAD6UVZ1_9AGAR|nr:hypothetical protein GGX14DRAFT_381003 [Mycena pura]KAJ7191542.1 hypothetical protein GGX14DRAFT_381043 [Mycena pura]